MSPSIDEEAWGMDSRPSKGTLTPEIEATLPPYIRDALAAKRCGRGMSLITYEVIGDDLAVRAKGPIYKEAMSLCANAWLYAIMAERDGIVIYQTIEVETVRGKPLFSGGPWRTDKAFLWERLREIQKACETFFGEDER